MFSDRKNTYNKEKILTILRKSSKRNPNFKGTGCIFVLTFVFSIFFIISTDFLTGNPF